MVFDEAENRLHAQKGRPRLVPGSAGPDELWRPATSPTSATTTSSLPYTVESLSTRGRVAAARRRRIDAILKRHDYPDAGRPRRSAEAATLAVLLGASLKQRGPLPVADARATGPVSMLLVDFDAPSNLRALARFDEAALAARLASAGAGDLLGEGLSRLHHRARTAYPVALSGRRRARRARACRSAAARLFRALRADSDAGSRSPSARA